MKQRKTVVLFQNHQIYNKINVSDQLGNLFTVFQCIDDASMKWYRNCNTRFFVKSHPNPTMNHNAHTVTLLLTVIVANFTFLCFRLIFQPIQVFLHVWNSTAAPPFMAGMHIRRLLWYCDMSALCAFYCNDCYLWIFFLLDRMVEHFGICLSAAPGEKRLK